MTVALMEYLDYSANQAGPRKYVGAVAQGYDEKREESDKWKIEQAVIEDMLSDLQWGDSVLDAPCGTGRFFPFYDKKRLVVFGLDASTDMLQQAAKKIANPNEMIGDLRQWTLGQGDVRKVPLEDNSVDAAINCRITRWLTAADCQTMIREMQRVARKKIVFTARVANHPHARPIELFEQVLDGWKIARNEAGYTEEYRIVMLEPIADRDELGPDVWESGGY